LLLNGARARPPHTAEQGTLVESIEQGDGYKGKHSDASQRRCRTRASVILVVQQRLMEYGGGVGGRGRTRGGGVEGGSRHKKEGVVEGKQEEEESHQHYHAVRLPTYLNDNIAHHIHSTLFSTPHPDPCTRTNTGHFTHTHTHTHTHTPPIPRTHPPTHNITSHAPTARVP
jgi:hypothetical protein